MECKVNEIFNLLKGVIGIEDPRVIKSIGFPELGINLDQQKMF